MQATGNLVAVTVKLTTGMQGGHHQLQGGHFLLRMLGHRNTAAVVNDRNAVVWMNCYLNMITDSGQSLIY